MAGDAFSTEGLDAEAYIELEFSGFVTFDDFADDSPIDSAINVMDNVWRLYMKSWSSPMDWETFLHHIGSQKMKPEVTWAQVCPSSAATDDLNQYAADGCKFMEKYRWIDNGWSVSESESG